MSQSRAATRDGPVFAGVLIAIGLGWVLLVLFLPLATVFFEALSKGVRLYLAALADEDALAAVRLTLLVTAIAVPLNTIFGLAAAWCVTKFEFWGKSALMTLIDLPISISPVISGLVYVLIYSINAWAGRWLFEHNIDVLFAVPGIVLATTLVTFPYVARELIPLMQQQGTDEEAAAATLGAGPLRTFLLVTLPNVKWALMYGVLLCTARAMGEFGAVSVVSGQIRGKTATMPLHIEILYNEYNYVAAFGMASLLALFALVTLVVKTVLEQRFAGELAAQRGH
jgi:sulfate/thiosulfate transport system permease protein